MSYYSKVLYPFVERLIREKRYILDQRYYLDINDLDDLNQYQFALHLIEYDDRDLHCLYENNHYDEIISALFSMLKNPDIDNKLNFSDTVKDKIISYYKPKMQSLVDDIIGWVEQEDYLEKGFVTYKNFSQDSLGVRR